MSSSADAHPSGSIPDPTQKGLIAWFARNPVAANLLMIAIIGMGLTSAINLKRSLAPEVLVPEIGIKVAYPGASPGEVSDGVVLKVEEALETVEGIKRIRAFGNESMADITVEVRDDYDTLTVMDEVKSAVDGITNFPEQAEKPVISRRAHSFQAISFQLSGVNDERSMKALVQQIKSDLSNNPNVGRLDVYGERQSEIAIHINQDSLYKYDLTLEQVAAAIRSGSLDLPGGAIKSERGEILVRAHGQAYREQDFANLVLITRPDGTRLLLGDIATIEDGFEENKGFAHFNGRYSVGFSAYAVGDQDIITVADAIKTYIDEKNSLLPAGAKLTHWADVTEYLKQRIDMMLKNLGLGALLVLIVLALFLDLKLAFWVMVGLPVCFLGAFFVLSLPAVDQTLNMMSLFGFILVLGIVVDDAIIIGESAFSETERSGHSLEAVIRGAQRVALPATFGVLTTIAAFMPTLFVDGTYAPMPAAVGFVVVSCLAFSLVESKLILPAHLGHTKPSDGTGPLRFAWLIQQRVNGFLQRFIRDKYLPFVSKCIERRYVTAASFVGILVVVGGLVGGGQVRIALMDQQPSDFVNAQIEMVTGSGAEATQRAYQQVSAALDKVNNQLIEDGGYPAVLHTVSWGTDSWANFMVELTKDSGRRPSSIELGDLWRDAIGSIPGVRNVSVKSADDMGGPSLAIELIHKDPNQLEQAARELQEHVATYEGLYEIQNSAADLRDEVVLNMLPKGEAMGLTLADVANQVRHALYGAEAQRIQRGEEEVKVMVRYPKDERRSLADLENLTIKTPQGDRLPLNNVVSLAIEAGSTTVRRIDSANAIRVSANAQLGVADPDRITAGIVADFIPELKRRYPGLDHRLSGMSEQFYILVTSLFSGLIVALAGIYVLLAIPLRSYTQPLIIMGVIPFGIIGAVLGHLIMGFSMSMMSFFGIIALSGVVVNDSLIMVDHINRSPARGESMAQAVINAGRARFRPILLTSLTTFFGLLPMLLEGSLQAQFVLPMAISLAFGIVFATVITLLLIPCLYVILEDIKTLAGGTQTATDEARAALAAEQ